MEYENKIEAEGKEYIFQNDGYHVHYTKRNTYTLWEKAIEWININESVLEIGCGAGQFAHMVSDRGIDYIGFDFSKTGIKLCESLKKQYDLQVKFYLADARKLYSINRDVIVCFSVLEHIKDDRAVIDKIPSGKKFIFIVPSFDDIRHVRTFESKKSIIKRYGDLLDIKKIIKKKPKFYRKRCHYLVMSIKK